MAAKNILNPAANPIPNNIARRLIIGDKPAAAMPITNALSPERIISAKII